MRDAYLLLQRDPREKLGLGMGKSGSWHHVKQPILGQLPSLGIGLASMFLSAWTVWIAWKGRWIWAFVCDLWPDCWLSSD